MTELCETIVHTAEVFWFVATLITISSLIRLYIIGSADVSSLFKNTTIKVSVLKRDHRKLPLICCLDCHCRRKKSGSGKTNFI